MKCYNSFGEMFRANGGDRSVFNGIAQTKVTTRDPAGNTEEIYLRFSTEKPGRDSAWYYLEEASNKYKELSTAPKHIQAAVDKVGKGVVEGDFLGRVTVETKKNPKFDAANLSDEQLAKYLNAITQLNNGGFDWSVPGESKKNPNPNPSSSKYDPNKTYIKATGIVSDGKDGKNKHLIKVGMDKGKPFIEEYDATGSKVNCSIKAEDVLGIHFMDSIKNTPEAFANIDETRFAQALVARNKYGGSGFSSVYWRGGDVDAKALVQEFQNNNTLQKALDPNDRGNKGGILKRLVRGTKQMLW